MRHVRVVGKMRPRKAAESDPMGKVIYQSPTSGYYITPSTIIDNLLYLVSPTIKWG